MSARQPKVRVPRLKKSRPARIHVGRPIPPTGWKLPCTWVLVAWRGEGSTFQKKSRPVKSYAEGNLMMKELLANGWNAVELRSVDNLTPLAK